MSMCHEHSWEFKPPGVWLSLQIVEEVGLGLCIYNACRRAASQGRVATS